MKKRSVLILVFSIFILASFIFSLSFISAQETNFVCAERTTSGAWCQNVPQEQADTNFRTAPTSCESTSFCRLGTCVDSGEGLCSPNTPQIVCQDDGGVWVEGEPEEIPQCQLGCCFLGDNAAFVTQTRCTSLSSTYGLDTNFRQDIRSEIECIASAFPQEKGACVFDDGFSRNCRLLTREECQEQEATATEDTSVEFHEDMLCSAETLGTICGPSERTTCVADKDEVFFLDSCGNLANIYDASQVDNQEYWTRIFDRDESCNPDAGNAGSATCGSCDYLLGSTCKAFQRGNSLTPTQPQLGDNVCADLSCRYQGERFEHGEKWCGQAPGIEKNLPGSEYYTLTCYSGEVTVEQCSAFRAEVCLESEIGDSDFSTAACRVNRWQDCVFQENQQDCENIDRRDCQWIEGQSVLKDEDGRPLVLDEDGDLVPAPDEGGGGAACVPLYAPGFDFWNPDGEAEELCAIGSENCIVKFTKGILPGSDWSCKENCHCLEPEWEEQRNNICIALGDCGAIENFIGVEGYHSGEAVKITKDIE